MSRRTAITVLRPPEETRRQWESTQHPQDLEGATVTFKEAPGDRGTEIHVELADSGIADKLKGGAKLAKAKDGLRHFKQRLETGEHPRSDGSPEGERAERKFKQRPAQPLERAGAR